MNHLKFLAVIPVYNKENTIKRAVKSVLHSSMDCDVLIINDGSTDNSVQVINLFNDSRISLIHQNNHGVSYSRNQGIQHAIDRNYTHVAFLDADDYWLPNHIDQIKTLIRLFPEADLLACNYQIKVGKAKWNKTKYSHLKKQEPKLLDPFFKFNQLNSILSSSSFCMDLKREDLLFYKKELTHTEDTDFLIRAGIEKKIAFHPMASVVIDQTGMNRSSAVPLANRTITNFDEYEEQYGHVAGLKKYLDINRFSIAIGYRLDDDIKNAAIFQHKINVKNLSAKQRQLLKMSSRQLKSLKRTQQILGNLGFRLRTGS